MFAIHYEMGRQDELKFVNVSSSRFTLQIRGAVHKYTTNQRIARTQSQ